MRGSAVGFVLSVLLPVSQVAAFVPAGIIAARVTTHLCASQAKTSSHEMDRRKMLATGVAAAGGVIMSTNVAVPPAQAIATNKKKRNQKLGQLFFGGTIDVKPGAEMPMELRDAKNKILYITARPKNIKNMPPEVVAAGRRQGQIPAVLAAYQKNAKLPFTFELPAASLTPEGDFGLDVEDEPYWWEGATEWEISARYDTDGRTRTFDPTDLVGTTIVKLDNQNVKTPNDKNVNVQLAQRGVFGSYFKQKQS